MGGLIVDTTFKKYGLNNVNSGKVEYSFLVAKFLKHCYFQAMFTRDLIRISGCLLMKNLNLNDIAM